jgi:23S rRNA (cytidine1920-2'-O)/16S rRNA (cytidine1409-2'-O)-methyltransferase
MASKQRLDVLLVNLGLCDTRTRAQALILAGRARVDGVRVDKAGTLIAIGADVALVGEPLRYVSRGGIKLEGALDTLGVSAAGLRCLDIGASTGGFTDCLLQRGAASVAAVDVGYGQLAEKIRNDPRVLNLERTNARTLEPDAIGGAVDLTVVDASFIGLGKLLDAVSRCTKPGGRLVALIKPQFESGRQDVAKGRGVISDPAVRQAAIDAVLASVTLHGFLIEGSCDSPLAGPRGNLEAFVCARRR